jgi:hypothetical protein
MHNAHTFAAYVYAALGASYYRSLSPESLLVRFRTKQITFTAPPPRRSGRDSDTDGGVRSRVTQSEPLSRNALLFRAHHAPLYEARDTRAAASDHHVGVHERMQRRGRGIHLHPTRTVNLSYEWTRYMKLICAGSVLNSVG